MSRIQPRYNVSSKLQKLEKCYASFEIVSIFNNRTINYCSIINLKMVFSAFTNNNR